MTRQVANLGLLPKRFKKGRICAVVDSICPFSKSDKKVLIAVLQHAKDTNLVFYKFYVNHGHNLAVKMLANPNTDWQKVVDWEYGVISIAETSGVEKGMVAYFLGVFGMVETFWTECEDPLFMDLHSRKYTDFATLDTQWTRPS